MRTTRTATALLAVAVALALACALGARAARAQGGDGGAPPDIDRFVREHPLAEGEPLRIDELARTASASLHVIQVRSEVPPNYHIAHDETVVLWRGRGELVIGERRFEIGPGTPVLIPRRVVHAFRAVGPEPAVAILIFTPAFDGKDRFSPGAGESEANRRLRELAIALAAHEIDAVATLLAEPAAKALGPEERAKLAGEVDALRADPLQRNVPDAIAAFPELGALPADATSFTAHVAVEAAGSPLIVKVAFRKVGERWLVSLARLESRSGVLPEAIRLEHADATDLRDVLRAAAAKDASLAAAAEAMPSFRGLWPDTRSVMLIWGTRERVVRVEFRKAEAGWVVER